MKNGPNDMCHVVWALGTFFSNFFFFMIFYSNLCFLLYLVTVNAWKGTQRGWYYAGSNKKGPKQHKTHCLGPRHILFCVFILNNDLYDI